MTPTMLLSKETIFQEYGIFFTEPYLVIRNVKDYKDADLLHRILTIYQKYCSSYTVTKASQQYLINEEVGKKDYRMIFAYAERRAYDAIYQDCQTLLKNAGTEDKPVEIELLWEKPVFSMSAVTEEIPKFEFNPLQMLNYPNGLI